MEDWMSIDFSSERWQSVAENSKLWWKGELKRPLIQFTIGGRDPGRPEPALPHYQYAAFYDLDVPAEHIVDCWDYALACHRFMGDAFPCVFPNFGPGVAAAFLGAELGTSKEAHTCWFHPTEDRDLSGLELRYDPDNVWLRRVKDICRAAQERWEGMVQVGMTDLGGNLDILSVFRPGEKLLLDLYDCPEDVNRRTWEAHELWWRYFDEINAVLQPANPGYTAWASIFSTEPYYMLQCDFCYMIGPDMFDEFVKPELAASCRRLVNPFYHLDGPGQLPHLDSLLTIPELKGVQWVPGAGVPGWAHWPDVYRRIRDAGKLIQVYGGPDVLDAITGHLGCAEGIVTIGGAADEQEAMDCLRRYGAA